MTIILRSKIPQHFWNLKFQLDFAKLRKDGGRSEKLEKKRSESYTTTFSVLEAANAKIETQKISVTSPAQAKEMKSCLCPGMEVGMPCSPSLKVPGETSLPKMI